MKESFTRKLVRRLSTWAGHWKEGMERIRLTKRLDALRVEDRRKRGRPILRWEDCVKKDLAGGERD